MSKTLLTVAFIVAAVAAPELIPGLLGVAAGSLVAIAATAAVEVGLSLAANQLIGPSTPKGIGGQVNNQVQRLFTTSDTTAPRKIVFGITAGATDLRYQSYTGTNQRYYEQIIAVASHQVNSIFEIWFDNEKAWTSSGGVQGRYVGFLTVDAITLGTSSNGIAIDGTWTSTCTLTGCAYIHLKFDLLGTAATGGTNNSPFASGVTSRVTVRTNGALIYDPRLDSTVSGGSGSQRANTQSTWAWDANASRNPALQLLWYLLGWKINGKLAVGRGIPPARLDLASFAVAANACDASITLNGGGTEPRYRADGVVTEGDDPQSVIESLCAAMNAVLRDAGGKLSLTVLTNDLASPVASFTEADILGSEQWDQTPSLSSTFNICRGRRVDPSDNALYQLVDVPEASLTSNDGIDRIDTMDMPFVSSNGQAQRLLKQRLQRKQYQGKFTLTGNARWWQTSLGNVIQLSHAGLGWTNKLFRVAAQSISRDGTTKMTLIEENAAIYAWSNNEAAAVTPGTPTIYDPLHSPLSVITAKLGTVAVPRGFWSSASVAYNVNDLVYYGGTAWICILAYTSSATTPPNDPTHWQKYSSATLDDLGDGTTYGRPIISRLNGGKPWIDFAEPIHSNQNLDYIGDGPTYGRPIISRLNGGKPWIDFAEPIHSNKNIDYIGDGLTYGRPIISRLNAGKPWIDFAETIHSNKNIDNIGDGTTYRRPRSSMLSSGAYGIADIKRVPPLLAMNLGYKYSGSITFSTTFGSPCSATINVAAGTAVGPGVSYNANSTTITNSAGETHTYYLYYQETSDDPSTWGGTRTLNVVSDGNAVYQSNVVWIGTCTITYPTSSGGTVTGSPGVQGGGNVGQPGTAIP